MTYTVTWTQEKSGKCELSFATYEEAQDFYKCLIDQYCAPKLEITAYIDGDS